MVEEKNVKLVLHGHKHVSYHVEHDGLYIIACGSSTGQKVLGASERAISYNIIQMSKAGCSCVHYGDSDFKVPYPDTYTVTFGSKK